MAKRLLVLSSEDLILSFLIQGDDVYRICAEEKSSKRLTDSIFKGRVKRLARGMDGVFVDVGLDRDAFLPLKDESYRIGESLVVQMVREPEGEKGAKLTTNIKLVGKYLIYFPKGKEIKCSSKVNLEDRERLCSLIEGELKDEGVILRSSAVNVEVGLIKEELQRLRNTWHWIQKRAKSLKKPQVILEEYPVYIRLIRDHWQDIEEIVSDDPLIWNSVASFLEDFEPRLLRKNIYIKDPATYIQNYRLHDALRSVFNKVVWLRGGGYIVIEETEAFTVIDVNSGDPTGSCHEENALRTNMEAVGEIVRQILLRDIGGIILIDFIDMKKQENKNLIINTMQSAFGEEACGVTIYGFTKLGILEMSRRKTGRSITKILSEPCPTCSGRGLIKSSSLFLLELDKELASYAYRSIEVKVHPLRHERVRRLLQKYPFMRVKESQEMGINQYHVGHA